MSSTVSQKVLPVSRSQLEELVRTYPTPFHLYDERAIRQNARRLNAAFDWCPGFKEYYAVKAAPNPHLLAILREEGFGADCSSLMELMLAQSVGLDCDEVMFTSNNTRGEEYQKALEMGALINLDDLTHIEFLEEVATLPDTVCFRYKPGATARRECNHRRSRRSQVRSDP